MFGADQVVHLPRQRSYYSTVFPKSTLIFLKISRKFIADPKIHPGRSKDDSGPLICIIRRKMLHTSCKMDMKMQESPLERWKKAKACADWAQA